MGSRYQIVPHLEPWNISLRGSKASNVKFYCNTECLICEVFLFHNKALLMLFLYQCVQLLVNRISIRGFQCTTTKPPNIVDLFICINFNLFNCTRISFLPPFSSTFSINAIFHWIWVQGRHASILWWPIHLRNSFQLTLYWISFQDFALWLLMVANSCRYDLLRRLKGCGHSYSWTYIAVQYLWDI